MKTLYIIIILLIIFFTAIAGIIYLNKDTWDLKTCSEECQHRGYETGSCLWPTEKATNHINIGPCFIAQSRHCGNKGQCNCYCRKQITEEDKTYCTDEQREIDACIEIYQPVCGWANENIKCLKYPCASNYQNYCFACLDKNVEYYTKGECPNEQIVGGDKDEHGCIGSAGYTWNETKQECVREWEETLKHACIELGCGENMLFAGSKNSDKYYNCDCGWAKTINPENLICFSSDEQALADNRIKSEC